MKTEFKEILEEIVKLDNLHRERVERLNELLQAVTDTVDSAVKNLDAGYPMLAVTSLRRLLEELRSFK